MQGADEEEAERANTDGNEDEEAAEAEPDEPVDEPIDTDEADPEDNLG